MEKRTDQTAVIMNRLQEREKEQLQILSICSALAQALSKEEFNAVVSGLLKEHFHFDDFIFASSNENETEYQIFYQFLQKISEGKSYAMNDGFFNACLESADTVVFDLKAVKDKKNNFPGYINIVQNKGFKNGVGICLPYIKGNRNVLFLFFKNGTTFGRESSRTIRGIAMQLSITVRNIMMAEEYENKIDELKILKRNLGEKKALALDIKSEGFHGIVGNSNAMQNVYELIAQVAPSQSTVFIFGETGTGKELAASAIHNLSSVSNKRMIKVNCASIPVNLIESELFGHEKGAFTGATELRIGKFEQAENSTIFLDEIGELPLELQGKLLRVLQEKEIERIGGENTIKVNARVIAATNRSLEKEVAEDRFRSDLYYRLNVYPIPLPALRDRREDIAVLGNFFLKRHAEKIGKKIKGFSKKVLNSMTANEWPGNVRELENMVERSILFAKDEVIKEMIFPQIFRTESGKIETEFYIKTLQEVEKDHILRVVKKCNGRISGPQGAAVLLDLPGTTLISKMQKLGIKKEHFLG
ncbi:sigma-54 interaction domain-containing protein [Flavobacterium sp. ZS1P14]|uniref:sigma-54 interaction domain-containing protein n=1 Tax=Flavobacterium sp. ZS1P14 TaxID=3401729 RepID=UPI003AAC11B8